MGVLRWRRRLLALSALLLLGATGCGAGGGGSSQPIVFGADLPLTGALGRFGELLQLGYTTAVHQVNGQGGIDVGGTKRTVKLVVLDDGSDPQKASQNTNTLILQDGAAAILGSVTPPQSIAIGQVAEARHIPMFTISPIRAFIGGAPQGGWKYSWAMLFDELQMTRLQFQTMDTVASDKKVALFTDQEQDGQTMGALWEKAAPANGYQIAYHASFPVGTTDYSDFVRKAQAAGADVLISQMEPPDAIALWKQMKALNWKPKAAFMEKSANTTAWYQGLGADAGGTSVSSWWAASLGYPDTTFALDHFGKAVHGNVEMGQATAGYTQVEVLADALHRAGVERH
jgi:branched-chain amino acid transport system substrate-binding protein